MALVVVDEYESEAGGDEFESVTCARDNWLDSNSLFILYAGVCASHNIRSAQFRNPLALQQENYYTLVSTTSIRFPFAVDAPHRLSYWNYFVSGQQTNHEESTQIQFS